MLNKAVSAALMTIPNGKKNTPCQKRTLATFAFNRASSKLPAARLDLATAAKYTPVKK